MPHTLKRSYGLAGGPKCCPSSALFSAARWSARTANTGAHRLAVVASLYSFSAADALRSQMETKKTVPTTLSDGTSLAFIHAFWQGATAGGAAGVRWARHTHLRFLRMLTPYNGGWRARNVVRRRGPRGGACGWGTNASCTFCLPFARLRESCQWPRSRDARAILAGAVVGGGPKCVGVHLQRRR